MANDTDKKYITEEDIEKIVEKHMSSYINIIKYFLYGFAGFLIIGFGSGLILPKNILREIHDGLFGSEKIIINKIGKSIRSEVGVSYHRSFLLKSPDQREEIMLFFAQEGQKVKVYLETSHYGKSKEKRRIIVALDNQILWDKIEDFKGGFKDITSRVFAKEKPMTYREESVHALEFFLDVTQPTDLIDTVFLDCVIIVYGKLSDAK